jgi:hypothetical protein
MELDVATRAAQGASAAQRVQTGPFPREVLRSRLLGVVPSEKVPDKVAPALVVVMEMAVKCGAGAGEPSCRVHAAESRDEVARLQS